jgi:hypothetical protein
MSIAEFQTGLRRLPFYDQTAQTLHGKKSRILHTLNEFYAPRACFDTDKSIVLYY